MDFGLPTFLGHDLEECAQLCCEGKAKRERERFYE